MDKETRINSEMYNDETNFLIQLQHHLINVEIIQSLIMKENTINDDNLICNDYR